MSEQRPSSVVRFDEAEEHPDRRRLAGPIGTEKPVDGSARNHHVQPLDRQAGAEPLAQTMGLDRRVGRGFGRRPVRQGRLDLGGRQGHEAFSAAYSRSGATAPTATRPSSVMTAEKSVPSMTRPDPQSPVTFGTALSRPWSCLSCEAPATCPGMGATATDVQPFPTTVGSAVVVVEPDAPGAAELPPLTFAPG